ncbi:uncharacterized protein LOC113055092 isoform X4 [Carassius auratus]|uniref:Uncharacterized protein LOC113055092 isoform X4 n=1 Tax=Carassius auratus TaxID=7957 RepID=A0A6P6KZQ7_CARAU|nr:uncharacterized protein LOC113055092 isoform X4 [Carassius auratus]
MGLGSIRSFLMKRMTAVAEEILNALKDNIIEYEQEIERLKQENYCLRSALTETCHDDRGMVWFNSRLQHRYSAGWSSARSSGFRALRNTSKDGGCHSDVP